MSIQHSLFIGLLACIACTSSVFAARPADFNQDGWIDFLDLVTLTQNWFEQMAPPCPGDTDGDCDTDYLDFANLARNWQTFDCSSFTAQTSSVQASPQFDTASVLDGTLATRWASIQANNQWLTLDLGQIRNVTGLQIYWHDEYASNYNVVVSLEGGQWTQVYGDSSANGGFDDIDFTPVDTRLVRINCVQRATSLSNSIMEVYVKTDDDCLAAGEWDLVWADEFGGNQLDTSKWECMTGTGNDFPFNFGLWGWGNGEHQYYTCRSENVSVANGELTITARQEQFADKNYTSARLRSAARGDFMYGKIEARMKVPRGGGMWPAFWLMPTGDKYGRPYFDWAAHGEIDIMETRDQADFIQGTIHYGGTAASGRNVFSSGFYAPANNDFSRDFHTYTLEWDPTMMKWYVDGNLYSTKTSWWSDNGPFPAPFDQPFHILMNIAVGGFYAGCAEPDASCITALFPQTLKVDYVRVYRRND